jgi:hypothetical protein
LDIIVLAANCGRRGGRWSAIHDMIDTLIASSPAKKHSYVKEQYYGFRMTMITSAGEEILSPPNKFSPPQNIFPEFQRPPSVVDFA